MSNITARYDIAGCYRSIQAGPVCLPYIILLPDACKVGG